MTNEEAWGLSLEILQTIDGAWWSFFELRARYGSDVAQALAILAVCGGLDRKRRWGKRYPSSYRRSSLPLDVVSARFWRRFP